MNKKRISNEAMRHLGKYLIGLLLIGVFSCESTDENSLSFGSKAYFPLRKNFYQIYAVDETWYVLGQATTNEYELKTQVVDSFPDPNGELEYVIHRSKRNVGETEWTYLDSWSARVSRGEVVVREGNVPYLKIKLPLFLNTYWDGNLYNTLAEDKYLLAEINKSKTISGAVYSNCLTVNQTEELDEDFIVFFDRRQEVYAKDVGLVQKELTQLHYCTDDPCLGQQIVESGRILMQRITSYGIEQD